MKVIMFIWDWREYLGNFHVLKHLSHFISCNVRMDINKFAKIKAAAYVPRRPTSIIGKNQQLFDLGMNHIEMEQKSVSYGTHVLKAF